MDKSYLNIDFSSRKREDYPSPLDLETFIPWACGQMQMPCIAAINKVKLSEPARENTTRSKNKEDVISDAPSDFNTAAVYSSATSINIDAVYDSGDNLVQLKFNKYAPAVLLKLFCHIVEFHPNLTAIYLNHGLDHSGLYELGKILAISNVTELILDNCQIKEANYYILLENNTPVKYLSLSRCMLNDVAVTKLISRLTHPSKASKTLSVLNLSSNRITDDSADYIGDMLRANRNLLYLNLSGNMISDAGADNILSSLMTFSLTTDDISGKKGRSIIYIMEKKKFIEETVVKMRIDYEKRYAAKKRTGKPVNAIAKKTRQSVEVPPDDITNIGCVDASWLKKAEAEAEAMYGLFQDPFSVNNIFSKDGILYCNGNNVLCYLNLAYNNLSYFSVKKLHEVIVTQHFWNKNSNGRGLINVCIEGNNIPASCKELDEIDALLEIGLARTNTSNVMSRKKMKTN